MTENALAASAARLLGTPPADKAASPVSTRAPAPFSSTHAPDPGARPDVRHREDVSAGYQSAPHSKPTKAPLQTRSGSPSGSGYVTSGVDAAMHRLADEMHRPALRPRRR